MGTYGKDPEKKNNPKKGEKNQEGKMSREEQWLNIFGKDLLGEVKAKS